MSIIGKDQDELNNQIVEIWEYDKELGEVAGELARLRALCENDIAKAFLTTLLSAYLQIKEQGNNQFLGPMQLENPDRIYTGPPGVGDLHMKVRSDGMMMSVWKTNDLIRRIEFMRTGMIMLGVMGPVPVLEMNLDVSSMFEVE